MNPSSSSEKKSKQYSNLEEVGIEIVEKSSNSGLNGAESMATPTLRKFPVADEFLMGDLGKTLDTPNFVKDLHSTLLLQPHTKDSVHSQPLIEAPVKDAFFIKTSDNQDKEIMFQSVSEMTVLELKKYAFSKAFDENKNIRLIFQGRQLGDAENVSNLKIKPGGFMHAFISEKVERKKTSTVPTQMNTEMRSGERVRGFERLRELGISPSDIVLQRFKYFFFFRWLIYFHVSFRQKRTEKITNKFVKNQPFLFSLI